MYPKLMVDNLPIAEFNKEDGVFKYYEFVPTWIIPMTSSDRVLNFTDFYLWLDSRLVPEQRLTIRDELSKMGLDSYYKMEIAKNTKACLMEDPYWIAFSEEDEMNWRDKTLRGAVGFPLIQYKDMYRN